MNIKLEEAIRVIEDFPNEDGFVTENYHAHMGMHNEYCDNSIELSDYYRKCKEIVNDYLIQKHG